jgi:iron(III) transport system ATP-binding protein
MSTLAVRGLTKRFGDVLALDSLDLDVPDGSLVSVLGPSGCGKTTFLRLVAGFLSPDAGTIRIDDVTVAADGRWVAPQERRIGYLPQEGALFPHLDVAANIGFGLRRPARTPARIGELLDLVELPRSMGARRPHELSGGQQQRVALARAMAPEPRLVLLDEPFSSLDAALRESTGRAVARALKAAGATGILVTHDQNEALSLADQVVTLREGRLVQSASPEDVYLSPADPELAIFVGGATVLAGVARGLVVDCPVGALPLVEDAKGPVRVVIRPEQVHFDDPSPVRGQVREVSYYGHDAAVRVAFDGVELVARITGGRPPVVGDEVQVTVRGGVLAFPAVPAN